MKFKTDLRTLTLIVSQPTEFKLLSSLADFMTSDSVIGVKKTTNY